MEFLAHAKKTDNTDGHVVEMIGAPGTRQICIHMYVCVCSGGWGVCCRHA